MPDLPTPHGDKLNALLQNEKLPSVDRARVVEATKRYQRWLRDLRHVQGTYDESITQMVFLLNEYKRHIEIDLVFDSNKDFLYRQKGQLKLDNTVIEEFLPILVTTALANELQHYELSFGPTTCFSGIRFESNIAATEPGGGMRLRQKDHDFAISRKLFLQASHRPDFQDSITSQTSIAYIAAEIKTNLDKTMFQEAAATALDVKTTLPGAKYFLLCEWLDMTPINTSTTAIDEVIILRKAKRLPSNIRARFNTASGRQQHRAVFIQHLQSHPLAPEMFTHFLNHIKRMIGSGTKDDIVERGYF